MTTAAKEMTDRQTALRDVLQRLTELISRPSLPPPHLIADLYETPDGRAYVIEAPMPGLQPEEITITASGDMLTLETQPADVAPESGRTYLVQEVTRQPLARVFTFPTPIDVDGVSARLEHGMLRITAPKAEGMPSRVVKVES